MKRKPSEDPESSVTPPAQPGKFHIQAKDFIAKHSKSASECAKFEKLAQTLIKTLKTGKLKQNVEYKNTSAWKKAGGIVFPLVHLSSIIERTSSLKNEFRWIAPNNIMVLNDKLNYNGLLDQFVVDIFVEIPLEIFGKRDFVNIVYPAKRAHYLCASLYILKKAHPNLQFTFRSDATQNEDELFPNLIVKDPSSPSGSIVLHFNAGDDFVKPSRFGPTLGNLRPSSVNESHTQNPEVPTPVYNQRILRNLGLLKYRHFLTEILKDMPALEEAVYLLRLWFKSRNLYVFNDALPALMIHFFNKDLVSEKHDLITVLKNFFKAIESLGLNQVIHLGCSDLDPEVQTAFVNAFPLTILDSTGYYNVCYNITIDDWNMAKIEIATWLPRLHPHYSARDFEEMLVDSILFSSQFDHYIRFSLFSPQLKTLVDRYCVDVVSQLDIVKAYQLELRKIFREAMSERFEYAGVKNLEVRTGEWSFSDSPSQSDTVAFVFGFKITKNWANPLTVGPIANDPSAQDFRKFWHGASQLRKFADTRICECMVWAESATPAAPLSLIQFLLEKKFSFPSSAASIRSNVPSSLCGNRRVTEKINFAFASLSATLRSLTNLPLMVTNIYGISPYIRGAEPDSACVFASNEGILCGDHRLPKKNNYGPYTPSVTVFLKLEYSGRWGQSFEAVRKLTAAFYIQIAESLKKRAMIAVPSMDQLFVVQDGIVFRLIIVNDRLLKILENDVQQLKDKGATRIEGTLQGKRLAMFQKKYVAELLLQGSLQSFSTEHQIYAETVQLTKKWLGSHLLSGVIPDLPLELLIVAAMKRPGQQLPRTAFAAFRKVLHLIVTHNWAAKPLLVDFYDTWDADEIIKLERDFVKMRPVLPPMVIITNEDHVGSKWTRDSPSPLLLKRTVALATTTLKFIDDRLETANIIDLNAVLTSTDTSVYDVIFNLHPGVVVRKLKSDVKIDEKERKIEGLPVVDFDPVEELAFSLNCEFGSSAVFFFNKYGGAEIALKFKPNEEIVPAKISRCHLHKTGDDSMLHLNRAEIIENIEIFGRGLIQSSRQN